MRDILVYILVQILIFGIRYLPYIFGIILSTIIICLINKMLIKKDKKFKILIYVIIIFICEYISVKVGYPLLSRESCFN